MKLTFLGNESGFGVHHTNAYFYDDGNLVFIDLSMSNIEKAKKLISTVSKNIYIVITHMHDDHFSGVTLFSQFCFYVNGISPHIVVPEELMEDILTEFKIKGMGEGVAAICSLSAYSFPWMKKVIPTTHAPELDGKCFGYEFLVNGVKVVYTGDTNTLDDFMPFVKPGCEFYVDMSFDYGKVHLLWDDVKKQLRNISTTSDVYLMHVDNIDKAKDETKHSNIEVVKTSE